MPIKFDSLEELKAFYTAFKLSGKSVDELEAPKKRGRKAKTKKSGNGYHCKKTWTSG